MTLCVTLAQDKVAVSNTVNTHVHDWLITHADDSYAAITASTMALMLVLALPLLLALALAQVLVVFVVRLAARALWTIYQTGKPLFRAMQLSLLIWLHCLLLLRVHVAWYEIAAYVNLFCSQAYDGDFPFTRGLVLLLNLRSLTALELWVLNLVFLLLWLGLLLPLHLDSCSNLSLVFML